MSKEQQESLDRGINLFNEQRFFEAHEEWEQEWRLMREGEPGDSFCILAQGTVKVTKNGRPLNTLKAGEPFGEMAYLSAKAPVRGADVTVDEEANIISVPSQSLRQASDGCRHKFDRAFMQILVERLSLANLRLSGV